MAQAFWGFEISFITLVGLLFTVKEQIFIGKKLRTFPSKTFWYGIVDSQND